MKSNRTIPYGYGYANGSYIVTVEESKVVTDIFMYYANGYSLAKIAAILNATEERYLVGKSWNKNNVSRILSSKNYLGTERYPAIIAKKAFVKAQDVRQTKSSYHNRKEEHTPEFLFIRNHLYCADCGERISRAVNKVGYSWSCQNPRCKNRVTNHRFITGLTEALNWLIMNPEEIREQTLPPTQRNTANIPWNSLFKQVELGMSVETAKTRAIELTKQKYTAICDRESFGKKATILLREQYANAKISDTPNLLLMEQTLEKIYLGSDGSVHLELKNAQKISHRKDASA